MQHYCNHGCGCRDYECYHSCSTKTEDCPDLAYMLLNCDINGNDGEVKQPFIDLTKFPLCYECIPADDCGDDTADEVDIEI